MYQTKSLQAAHFRICHQRVRPAISACAPPLPEVEENFSQNSSIYIPIYIIATPYIYIYNCAPPLPESRREFLLEYWAVVRISVGIREFLKISFKILRIAKSFYWNTPKKFIREFLKISFKILRISEISIRILQRSSHQLLEYSKEILKKWAP